MLKKWIGLLLAAALLAGGWSLPAAAAGQEDRVVRVAYPVQAGLTDFDEFGNYSGYTYEYLEEIAQYTGWDYEFVQVPGTMDDSLSALMGMLQEGEIDLMGAMLYTEQMGEMFDYASHNYGVVETVLQVPYDDVQEVVINSQVQQTIRVAVAEASQGGRMQRELEDYCAMNLITPVYVYRDTIEEQLEAVREGSADALLNTSLNYVEGSRAVARFAPAVLFHHHQREKRGDDGGAQLAIMSIEQTDPTFSNRL
ncbi:MAG: transporter substrate-binding domain-containing protein [Anaerotruncus massiliensis (ex Togo et al. 2019)]